MNLTNTINLKLLYCNNNSNIMKKILSTLLFTSLALATFAQQKITLKLAPELNKPIKYEVINKMDIEGPQTVIMDMIMHMNMTYTKVQDSLFNATGKYTYAKIDLDAGMMVASYDSSKEPTTEMEKAFATQFSPLLDNTLTYTMNDLGQIKEVDFPNVSEQIFDKSSLSSFGATFPSHPVAIGDSWTATTKLEQMNLDSKSTFTLKEKTAEGYKIELVVNITDEGGNSVGKSDGHFIIDPKTGVATTSTTVTTISLQGTSIKTTTDVKLVY